METFYTAYTKLLDFKLYYFVKKFTAFPELKNVAPVMDSYGMHTDFDKACSIAGITDAAVKVQLKQQADESRQTGKLVELTSSNVTGITAAV